MVAKRPFGSWSRMQQMIQRLNFPAQWAKANKDRSSTHPPQKQQLVATKESGSKAKAKQPLKRLKSR